MEEKTEETKLAYKRREDGVVLTEQHQIAMYMTFQQQEIMDNLLLGSYDSKGQYSIPGEFLKELVACNKVIKENFDNSYLMICRSNRGSKFNLKFVLSILKLEQENKKIAVLKLIEDVVKPDGETKERIATVIARYKDDDDIYFLRKVKKVFNLYTIDESIGKDVADETLIPELLKKQLSLIDLSSRVSDMSNQIAKIYVERLLKAMLTSGEMGKYVLAEYEKFIKALGTDITKAGIYKKLLYKLYGIITSAEKQYELDEEEKKRLIQIINEFLAATQNMFLEVNQVPIKQKKEEAKTKASSGSKSASKKSSAKKVAKKAAPKAKSKNEIDDRDKDPDYYVRRELDVEAEIEKEIKEKIVEKSKEENAESKLKKKLRVEDLKKDYDKKIGTPHISDLGQVL